MRNLTLFLLFLLVMASGCQNSGHQTSTDKRSDFPLNEITITELQQFYADGEYSIEEITRIYLERIEATNKKGPALNAIISVNPDALDIAQQLDKELENGNSRGPLHGVPVVLKDNIDTHDKMPTTAGSLALAESFPLQDSWVAQKLRDAGAIILGKANLSEWANFRGELSSSGWSAVGGQTRNPYVLDRNPCGSSSGSGVAVSANLCMLAVGTETNGSIVCPSHANGVVGIKPTVGLVSRSGVVPISFTQDTPGPMARTVSDAAAGLGAMTGIDLADSKTIASKGKSHVDYTQFLDADGLKGKRIGWFKKPTGTHFKVDQLMEQAIEDLKAQGAEVIEIDKISEENYNGPSFQVMLYEYKDGLNNYFASLGANAPIKSVDELIEFNKKDSIELMHFNQAYLEMANEKGDLDSDEYKEALKTMHEAIRKNGIDRVMEKHNLDAIVAPTGSPAWKTDWVNGDSYILGSSSPAAISGYPNITVPMGFIGELPVGISFFGKAWSEPLLLKIAYAYEQSTIHRKAPKFLTQEF